MKVVILFSLLFSLNSFASRAVCAVDGISDSPQQLTCNFPGRTILLSCTAGKYLLGMEPVLFTWHEEVEEGNTPMAFKTESLVLKITKQSRGPVFDAVLEETGPTVGNCR